MVKNCAAVKKLHFLDFFTQSVKFVDDIPFRFKILELKGLPFAYTRSSLSFIFE